MVCIGLAEGSVIHVNCWSCSHRPELPRCTGCLEKAGRWVAGFAGAMQPEWLRWDRVWMQHNLSSESCEYSSACGSSVAYWGWIGVALLVLAAWGAEQHPAAQAGTGAAQGSICSVTEFIKAALTLIISPVPDFLSRFYKLPFAGEPGLSCYHLRAWHECRCCRQTPLELAPDLQLCLLYCASVPLISRHARGLSSRLWPSVFSIPDTSPGLFLRGWLSPNMTLFSSLEFQFVLIPFDFPPSDKHLNQRIMQQRNERPKLCSQHV